jgi:hypothetical protein
MSLSPHVNPPDKNRIFIPPNYTLFSDAIDQAGRALFPDSWEGMEFQCSTLDVEGEPICTSDQIARRAKVEHFFQDQAANKGLKIYYRDEAGRMRQTPPEWWNVDNLTARFTLCKIDPDNPFPGAYSPIMLGSYVRKQTCTLFVDQNGLAQALIRVPAPHLDADMLMPLAAHSTSSGETLGVLPPNAGKADRANELYAHRAAELVRSGLLLSEALRRVAPDKPMLKKESIETGIRRTYSKMYNHNGQPL